MNMMNENMEFKDMRNFGFFMLENSTIDSGVLKNVYQIALYAVLCRYSNTRKTCFPSLNKLASILNCSRPKLLTTLKELEEMNIIKKVNRKKESGADTSNLYYVFGIENALKNINKNLKEEEEGVNEINSPCKSGLQGGVNEVNPIKKYIINKYINNNTRKKEGEKEAPIQEIKKEKKQETKNSSYDEIVNAYTQDIELRKLILEYIKMRKLNKTIISDEALKILLEKLDSITKRTEEKKEILKESILNNWKSVFPLKIASKNNNSASNKNNQNKTFESTASKMLKKLKNNEKEVELL